MRRSRRRGEKLEATRSVVEQDLKALETREEESRSRIGELRGERESQVEKIDGDLLKTYERDPPRERRERGGGDQARKLRGMPHEGDRWDCQ